MLRSMCLANLKFWTLTSISQRESPLSFKRDLDLYCLLSLLMAIQFTFVTFEIDDKYRTPPFHRTQCHFSNLILYTKQVELGLVMDPGRPKARWVGTKFSSTWIVKIILWIALGHKTCGPIYFQVVPRSSQSDTTRARGRPIQGMNGAPIGPPIGARFQILFNELLIY